MARSTPPLKPTATPGIYSRGIKRDARGRIVAGSFVVCFRDPQGKSRKKFAKTMKQACLLQGEMRTAVASGEYRSTKKERFADYARRWIEHYGGRTAKGIRDQTREDYKKRLEQDAIPYLGRLRMAEIEPRHLEELAQRIAKRGVRPNTVRLALAPVKALLADAAQRGDIRSNPAAGLRIRYEQQAVDGDGDVEEEVKALTGAELNRLLAQVPQQWRLFFEFLAATGLRIGEAIELRWKDVDLGRREFRVRRRFYRGRVAPPKSRFGKRTIRLSANMARALWQLQGQAGEDELVFTSPTGQRIAQSNLLSRVLKPAAVRAGVGEWVRDKRGKLRADSWVAFHTLRHTCATQLFLNGWNAKQVQVWLGHHKASFTIDTYIHLLPADLPEPPEFIERAVGNEVGNQTDLDSPKSAPPVSLAEAAKSLQTPASPIQTERAAASS